MPRGLRAADAVRIWGLKARMGAVTQAAKELNRLFVMQGTERALNMSLTNAHT